MAIQTRVTMPESVNGPALARKIAQLLDDTAQGLLHGVPNEEYAGYVQRYRVLVELHDFIFERAAAQTAAEAKGEILDED